jgi:hypothetical protein
MPVIASTQLRLRLLSGATHALRLEVEQPQRAPTGEWRCIVRIVGLHDKLAPIAGEDSLQSLTLALGLLRRRLEAQVQKGARLLQPNEDEDFPLEGYFTHREGRAV